MRTVAAIQFEIDRTSRERQKHWLASSGAATTETLGRRLADLYEELRHVRSGGADRVVVIRRAKVYGELDRLAGTGRLAA